jgi:hypothetical protein
MSCDSTARKIAGTAKKAGTSPTSNRFNHVASAMVDQALLTAYRAAAKAAVVSDTVLETVDRRGLAARLMRSDPVRAIVAGAALETLGRRRAIKSGIDDEDTLEGANPGTFAAIGATEVLPVAAAVTTAHQASTMLGNLANRAARGEVAGMVTQERPVSLLGVNLGKARERVEFRKSPKLTRVLNKLDTFPLDQKGVVHSDGTVFQTGGTTWHWGSLMVNTPRGERVVTHLQSLNLPASHYYFNCHLDQDQAAGIAAGRIRPERLPGYVGQVSALETLTVAWAAAKHTMIKNVLYFGSPRKKKVEAGGEPTPS